jgi:hypothetical protein
MRPRAATLMLLAWGGLVLALTCTALAAGPHPPSEIGRHLALLIAAGVAWGGAASSIPRLPTTRAHLPLILLIAVAARVPAWRAAPVHSDDVYRYLWDGRVQRAGLDPYRYPPDAAELAPLRDEAWQRINHRELPTIYPPLAQLCFRLAPSLRAWKVLVATVDLATLALLVLWLRRRGGDPRRAIAWAWSPLVVVEVAQNSHADAVGVLLLVGALAAYEARRPAWAGALLAGAAAIKLLGAALLPGLRSRRAAAAFALALALCVAPFAGAGARMSGSLGEYGRRWRVNDGAFALLYAAAERAVAHTRFAGRTDLADAPRLARAISGRERDQVYPDEVANLAARALALALWAIAVAAGLWWRLPPTRLAALALGGFALLTPTLHPWYVLWLIPLVAVGASPAWAVLAVLAPLGHLPLTEWWTRGAWHDPIWTRALEHGATWAVLLVDARHRWKRLGGVDQPPRSGKI